MTRRPARSNYVLTAIVVVVVAIFDLITKWEAVASLNSASGAVPYPHLRTTSEFIEIYSTVIVLFTLCGFIRELWIVFGLSLVIGAGVANAVSHHIWGAIPNPYTIGILDIAHNVADMSAYIGLLILSVAALCWTLRASFAWRVR